MISTEKINEILNIRESYELPEKLMKILLSEEREEIFEKFLEIESDLSRDFFTNYFQEEQSNRSSLMQDFTPTELCTLVSKLEKGQLIADICAGTGGLTIAAWNENKKSTFYCEELSGRAFPILLFNLSIRKINAIAVRKDILEDRYLYKAQRLDNGKWVQGIPFEIEGKTVILINDNENYLRVHYLEENMWNAATYAIEVNPSTICQCTGLKDKNGKLIWENDIVNLKTGKVIVIWDKAEWRIKWIKDNIWRKDLHYWINENDWKGEVIGNIFDNPELLEV